MNTKPVPAIVMLITGFITCIVSICQHDSFGKFVKTELLVLVIFYLFGCIIKLVLDKGFEVMQDPLSEYDGMDMDEDLIDEMAMSDDEYQDDYKDN